MLGRPVETPSVTFTCKTARTVGSVSLSNSVMLYDTGHMITHIGEVCFRLDRRSFGIRQEDRFQHLYIIGKTGVGKSSLLEFMALQDATAGNGFCFIDPHGDTAARLAASLGSQAIYLDLSSPHCPVGYNPLKHVRRDRIPLAVSGFMDVLKGVWIDAWGVRLEHILRNTLYALLETEEATITDISRMFFDKAFRAGVVAKLSNQAVKDFWLKEFPKYTESYRSDGISAIQNKLSGFLADPLLCKLLTEPKEVISLREVMDTGKILIVNLAKGRIGSDSANLLGGLLVTTLGLAAFSRADTPQESRRPYFLYVDEFQHFTTLSIVSMLSELRKYRLGMIFAHQFLWQLEPEVRHAVFGNVGSILVFRVGAEDAPIIAREMVGVFSEADLLWLPNYQFCLKLLIDGEPGKPFSGRLKPQKTTTPPPRSQAEIAQYLCSR